MSEFGRLVDGAGKKGLPVHGHLLDNFCSTPTGASEYAGELIADALDEGEKAFARARASGEADREALDAAVYLNMLMYHAPASQVREKANCARSIVQWALDRGLHRRIRGELAKEFSYAESAVPDRGRAKRDKCWHELRQGLDADVRGIPIVEEYLLASDYRFQMRETVDEIRENVKSLFGHTERPRLTSVHSIKGGTGKTTLAAALAAIDPDRAACILDLDFSGPSIDYVINDPELAAAIDIGEYRTLFNCYRAIDQAASREEMKRHDKEIVAYRLHQAKAIVQSGAFSLGTWLGYIATEPDEASIFRDLLENTVRALWERGTKAFVLDNSPGLYSSSAVVFTLACALGGTAWLVTTQRYDCLLSTLYEVPWDYVPTGGNMVVVANMVDNDYSIAQEIEGLRTCLKGSSSLPDGQPVTPYYPDYLRTLRYVIPAADADGLGKLFIHGGNHVHFGHVRRDPKLAHPRQIDPGLVARVLGDQVARIVEASR